MTVTPIAPDELFDIERFPVGSIGLSPSVFGRRTSLEPLADVDGLGEFLAYAVQSRDGTRFLITGHEDAPDLGVAVEADRPAAKRLGDLLDELDLEPSDGELEWDGRQWREFKVKEPESEAIADLTHIIGVGMKYAWLLIAIGIVSRQILKNWDPERLRAELGQANEGLAVVRRLPAASEVADWIEQAQAA
jgi:hypothetical protein